MKKTIFVANWKMNLTVSEAVNLVVRLKEGLGEIDSGKVEVVLCPSFTSLFSLHDLLQKDNPLNFRLGAQDVWREEKGAFTGEISPKMLEEVGCSYVIIGHSERRANLGETDEMVNQKVKAVSKHDLIPIICVGETFEERQKGLRDVIVSRQTGKALHGVELFGNKKIIIAYEPVWVIGTGQAVLPEDAGHSHRIIREALLEIFPVDVVEKHFKIIYGGSVDSKNIEDFIGQEMIDGVLVGGASLKVEEFVKMIKEIV
jgi:triosephosphate isomerase